MTRLSKTRIDKLKPDPAREIFEWCVDPRRFGVRISPTGRKTFVIQYSFHGRTRRYAIGTFGSITVDQARACAKELFAEIARGVDPSRERRVNKSAPSLSELADRYLEDHARVHKMPSSIRADEHNIKKHVKPKLGRLRVVDVTRQDLAGFHSNMSKHPVAANRCLALLGKMFACAQLWGIREDNPARGIPKFKEHRRERFLSESEFAQLGSALRSTEIETTEDPYAVAALRLLAVSGFRLGEILSLEWRDVDFERDRVTLREAKAGHRVAILNPAMRGILEPLHKQHEVAVRGPRRIAQREPRERSFYVIPGRVQGKPLVGIHRPWARICLSAKLADLRIHDLRHSFASLAAAGGMSLPTIGALLGHKSAQSTHRYVDWVESGLRNSSCQIGFRITDAMNGTVPRSGGDQEPESARPVVYSA